MPVSASDSTGGQTLSYAATGLPAGTSISATTGTITGTPATAGTSAVTVTARDGSGAFASQSFTWTVARAGSGATGPVTGYAGLCLDVSGGGTGNGTLVQLYTCNNTGAQVWQPGANGSLVNPQSGKCLDDTNWSTTPGTQVQIWSCTGAANQSWTLP